MPKLDYLKLPGTGYPIPALGFGSGTKWRIHKWDLAAKDDSKEHVVDELIEVTKDVIDLGLFHIDTAEAYTTWKEVGEGLKQSSKPRSEIFLTDKWSPGFRGSKKGPYDTLKTSLAEMQQEYVDLYLIHNPIVDRANFTLHEAWKEMIQLKKDGLAKNIGVSNFSVEYLKQVMFDPENKPQVDQIEFHAYLQNQSPGVVEFCKKNDILVEAYCPLTPILKGPGPLDLLLENLSAKYERPKSQILLRWIYQVGCLPLTTSSKVERIEDALKIFEFTLDDTDVLSITKLGREKVVRSFCQDLYGKYDDVLYN